MAQAQVLMTTLEAAKTALKNVPIGHDVVKAVKAIDEVLEMGRTAQIAPGLALNDRLVATMLVKAREAAAQMSLDNAGCAIHVNARVKLFPDGVPRVHAVQVSAWYVDGSTIESYCNGVAE